MTRLLLVRHGESHWNAQGRLQGHADSGLTAAGVAAAAATADFLRRTVSDVALIVRSDLARVAGTAAPAEAAFDVEVRADERLREIDVGTWSGLTWPEVAERDPDTLTAWRSGQDVARGGGETFAQLRRRVWDCLTGLTDVDGTVLVFTHGGPIRVAVAAALGLPPLGERLLAPAGNCSLTELVLASPALLRSYNRTDHLALT